MAVELLEALAADLLEYKNLVSLCVVIENGGLDHCALYIRSSDLHVTLSGDKKNLLELHISTFGISEPLHKDFITSLYFKLLACNFNDCVHYIKTY